MRFYFFFNPLHPFFCTSSRRTLNGFNLTTWGVAFYINYHQTSLLLPFQRIFSTWVHKYSKELPDSYYYLIELLLNFITSHSHLHSTCNTFKYITNCFWKLKLNIQIKEFMKLFTFHKIFNGNTQLYRLVINKLVEVMWACNSSKGIIANSRLSDVSVYVVFLLTLNRSIDLEKVLDKFQRKILWLENPERRLPSTPISDNCGYVWSYN